MKRLLFILIFSQLAFTIKADGDIVLIRNMFYRATKSSAAADSLVSVLKDVNNKSKPELIAYKGMSNLMICFHSYNPYTKFKNFSNGKELLELAIKTDEYSPELRFLRLSVQLNTPAFLGYNNNIYEDKLFILNNAKYITDLDLFIRIYNYTLTAKNLTVNEKQKMQKALLTNKLAVNIIN